MEEVFNRIDREELTQLAVDLGNIPSPPGHEGKLGEFIFQWLKRNGFEAMKQEVAQDRCNAVGVLRGKGNGLSLIFNSHMDVAFSEPEDVWIMGELTRADTEAWVEEDRVYGQGISNDKGPMAAFMIAAKAIKENGIGMKGDLILTMVCGEIGMAPVDEYQGPQYQGKGIGARHLVTYGVLADYALVAECSNFSPTWVMTGAAYIKITVRGKGIYTPFIKRPSRIEEHPNAIIKMMKIIEAVEEWACEYERKNTYEFSGGMVIPKANIGAIRAGLPYKPAASAGLCSIYVDVRVPAHKNPLDVMAELQEVVKSLDMGAEVQLFMFKRGYEGKNVTTILEAIEKAHVHIFKQKPGKVAPEISSMWRDINLFNEAGIPAVTYGPPVGISSEGWKPYLKVDDLVNTAKVYALIALDICNRNRAI